ncbi:uncharacterized protein LAJ45_07615 [Morchella importuna]|uniref:DUF7492 domain-containing protein n=1 Tax=Morchella conica CCBAS932 TaxID=1392247 RepID=A0A3N4L551_9PEZI|nr:uncharacterized protein LAJ45_07615 [Morchella importuna]KAH8148512.1 hypothetical protein LAJ45_07615 [Morchella importuna]RPB15761.1 hypothetical protein P167DRAFT_551726 [Morchella conica CCBAS932]
MKFQATSLFASALMAGSAAAHSWLACVDTNVTNYDECIANPNLDPVRTCNGFPRNKIYDYDWIKESSFYAWNLNNASNTEGLACRPGSQDSATYPSEYPMTTAVPGQTLRMRHWGNGHSRWDIGSPNHRDPGLVRVYWAGQKETELKYKSDLTEANWLPGAQANFSADAVTLITGNTMNEKANYFDLTLPKDIEAGRHSMVWVWAWDSGFGALNEKTGYDGRWANSWSTCFDIEIVDSDFVGPTYDNSDDSSYVDEDEDAEAAACSTATGYLGGMSDKPCTGTACPPCWYKSQTDGSISCYDYTSSGSCPWGGAFDCSKKQATRRALKHERAPFA